MTRTPASIPNRRRPTPTRSTGGAARPAVSAVSEEARAEAVLLGLLRLVLIGLGMLANPRLRDPAQRAQVRAATRALVIVCLRMAFRRGLSAGVQLLAILRGTAWEDRADLVGKVASGLAGAGRLPALGAQDATLIAERLDRWMRRAVRRAAARVRRGVVAPRASRALGIARGGAWVPGRWEAPGAKNGRCALRLCAP
ncbi:MAG: hypothetical protein JSR21_08895 [Proteobacteria bacterium]|nr:hypothetical protein [Pseudomonadota bacterium]